MVLDGLRADVEPRFDFLVRQTGDSKLHNLTLPCGERFELRRQILLLAEVLPLLAGLDRWPWLRVLCDRQGEADDGALFAALEFEGAAMRLDSRLAERKSDAKVVGLVDESGMKAFFSRNWLEKPGPVSVTRTSTKSASASLASMAMMPRKFLLSPKASIALRRRLIRTCSI
jgi:hypothetical protein